MRMADLVIYCSVLCDNEHEFSTFPINPYFCGFPSKFKWSDFTNVTHEELPKCTGKHSSFRHILKVTILLIFQHILYLINLPVLVIIHYPLVR